MARVEFETYEAPRFSARWWWNSARSALWVALVTVLIWVYADMEVADTENITVTVRLVTGKAQDLMLLSRPEEKAGLTVRGARAGLKRFATKYSNAEITYDVSTKYGPGKGQAIPMSEILAQIPEILELGLEVLSVTPSAITGVYLDQRVHKELDVEFVYSHAVLREPPPKTRVTVSLAKSRWEEILARQGEPVLKTVEENLGGRKPGETIWVQFEIIPLVAGVEVELAERYVTRPVVIEQLMGQKSIPITVRVLCPAEWQDKDGVWKEYVLTRQEPLDWRTEITVTGPVEDLEKLNPANVDAYVVLTEDDKKPAAWLPPREVIVRFPKGLKVTMAEGNKPTVTFKLEKIQPASP